MSSKVCLREYWTCGQSKKSWLLEIKSSHSNEFLRLKNQLNNNTTTIQEHKSKIIIIYENMFLALRICYCITGERKGYHTRDTARIEKAKLSPLFTDKHIFSRKQNCRKLCTAI